MCEKGTQKALMDKIIICCCFQKIGSHSWSSDCSHCPSRSPYIFVSAPRSPRICFMPNRWGKSSSHLGASAEKRRPSSLSSSIESDVGLPGTFSWIFFVVDLFECSQSCTSPARHNFGNRKEKENNSRCTLRIPDCARHFPHRSIGNRFRFFFAFAHAHKSICLTEAHWSIVCLFQHGGLEKVAAEWSGDFLKRCDKPIFS